MVQATNGGVRMEILKDYADTLIEIDYLNDQIKTTKYEFKWWSGVDIDKGEGTMLGGVGVKKFGVESGMIQVEKKRRALNNLHERLKIAEDKKAMIEKHLNKFTGIEYKIAYGRYVEHKKHKEIASDLGYTEQYIRKKYSDMKARNNEESTDTFHFV